MRSYLITTRRLLAFVLVLLSGISGSSAADGWKPQKPIQIIVTSGKGGASDQLARILAIELEQALEQKIILINKPGRAGSVAAKKALQAPSDGYTWTAGAARELGTYQVTGKLDTNIQDWHLYLATEQIPLVSVNPNSKYLTFEDLITDMQAGGKDLTVGTDGYTSSAHMAIEAIRLYSGGAYRLVSHASGKRAVRSTVSGETLATTQFVSEQIELLRAGRLRPLAAFSQNAVEIPGVGKIEPVSRWIKDFRVTADHFGLFLPEDTPKTVIDTLDHIWSTRIANSKSLAEYAESKGVSINAVSGSKAQAIAWPSVQQATWIYYDAGIAKISPETLGIPRL